jgi:hypothetical protein
MIGSFMRKAMFTGGCTATSAPDAPFDLTSSGVTSSAITLNWDDATSAPNQASSYEVGIMFTGSGIWTTVTVQAPASLYTFTSLWAGTTYDFRIRGVNCFGTGSYDGESFAMTTAAASCGALAVPDAPFDLASSGVTSTSITLEWDDTTASQDEADDYEIGISSDGGTTWTTITKAAPALSHTFTGLSASTTYDFRIRGINCFGTGNYDGEAFSETTAAASLSPSWTLDFSSGTPSGYTLTRASSGTYVDSSGYIASASTNVARLTHNSSGSRLGLLVEESRTNIALATENFTDTNRWFVTNATAADTTNTAPDNGADAESITEVAATSASYRIRSGAMTTGVAAGDTFTTSCFLKNAPTNGKGYGHVSVTIDGGTSRTYTVIVNLSTGALETTMTSGSPTGTAYTIENYGNGWYRVSATATAQTGATGVRVLIGMWQSGATDSNGYPTYTVSAGNEKSILAWGAQIEEGATSTSYLANTATTGSGVTRSADLAHVLDSSITSWGDPGALVIHFYPPGQAGTLLSTDDASTAQVGIEASSTTAARAFWSSGSTSTGTIAAGVNKAVHYWNGSTSKFAINGSTPVSGTNNLTIANTDFVTLGAEATDSSNVPGTFSQYANCVIRKVEFYSGTLTDANLQTITT